MGSVTLDYVKSYRDRHGRMRHYFRRRGQPSVALPGQPGSPEFIAAYAAVLGRHARHIGAERNPAGSVAQAIALYVGSQTWARYSPDTQRTRRYELERFRRAHGDKVLAELEPRHVARIVNDMAPVAARSLLAALSPWLAWCSGEGLILGSPVADIKRPERPNKDGFATWTHEQVAQYRAAHPVGSQARQVFELLVNIGAARVDTALLGRQHVRDGMLCYRRHKTGVLVEIPILPDLQAVIDDMAAADRLTFIAQANGRPYTKETLGRMFRAWRIEAGIQKGYSMHGLRKYAAKVRADLGATNAQLKAWFGWSTDREVSHYTRDFDRRRLAVELGKMVNAEVSNPSFQVSTRLGKSTG